jgi:hypothetical protein
MDFFESYRSHFFEPDHPGDTVRFLFLGTISAQKFNQFPARHRAAAFRQRTNGA